MLIKNLARGGRILTFSKKIIEQRNHRDATVKERKIKNLSKIGKEEHWKRICARLEVLMTWNEENSKSFTKVKRRGIILNL